MGPPSCSFVDIERLGPLRVWPSLYKGRSFNHFPLPLNKYHVAEVVVGFILVFGQFELANCSGSQSI